MPTHSSSQAVAETGPLISDAELAALEQAPAAELIRYAHERFGAAAVIGTSFQYTGLVILDLAQRAGLPLRVYTIDTLRLHAETYRHIEAVEARYGITVERVFPEPTRVAQMVAQHGEFLFFDSEEKRRFCCKIRKDEPNTRFMQQFDCWISGLRRDQSTGRAHTPKAAVTTKYGKPILKLNPLADWSAARVQHYVNEHQLPTNALHEQGYPTIGCTVCTTPVRAGEDVRAGRWRWEKVTSTKECGLHFADGAGI